MPKDFSIDTNYDLQIRNGDFVVDDCNEQDIEAILIADKGNWKQWPMLGIGIQRQLEGDFSARAITALQRNISIELTADGFTVRNTQVLISQGELLTINPDCERE
jgi:hypothetical protein